MIWDVFCIGKIFYYIGNYMFVCIGHSYFSYLKNNGFEAISIIVYLNFLMNKIIVQAKMCLSNCYSATSRKMEKLWFVFFFCEMCAVMDETWIQSPKRFID